MYLVTIFAFRRKKILFLAHFLHFYTKSGEGGFLIFLSYFFLHADGLIWDLVFFKQKKMGEKKFPLIFCTFFEHLNLNTFCYVHEHVGCLKLSSVGRLTQFWTLERDFPFPYFHLYQKTDKAS